jgi:two-component system sensor histidine kinase DegS
MKVSERAAAGTSIQLSFSVQGPERKVENVLEDNLLRICEEAVANAVKHARANQVKVTLAYRFTDVQLLIRDDGCGFVPAEGSKKGHFGLVGIMERVEVLSGMVSIDSAPGRGTSVSVTIPSHTAHTCNLRRFAHDRHEN